MTYKNKNAIVLLSGRSVSNVDKYTIDKNDTIFAINRKSAIEENLLKKTKRNVDCWLVGSPTEFVILYDEICEFLERDEDNRLITLSRNFYENRYLVEAKPLPNPEKVILIDSLHTKISEVVKGSQFNSLALLLSTLFINKVDNILLFGCDGVRSQGSQDIYFDQKNLSSERVKQNGIYSDMIDFHKYFPYLVKAFKNSDSQIVNMNDRSNYSCFDYKSNINSHSRIRTCTERFIFNKANYSNADLMQLSAISKNIEIIKFLDKKLRKKGFFKKLFNKLFNK